MKSQFFFEASRAIAFLLILMSIVIGFTKVKRLSNDQQILLALLIIVLAVESFSLIPWSFGVNNFYIYHFYSVVEFLLLGSLYKKHLDGLIKSIYTLVLMIAFVTFALINALFFQSLNEFNSNVTFTECLLLIILSILYFYKLLRDLDHKKLERVPMFWISMSVLTYFSGALILFHVANELIPIPQEERVAVWGTHALFNVVHYFLYGVALSIAPESQKSGN